MMKVIKGKKSVKQVQDIVSKAVCRIDTLLRCLCLQSLRQAASKSPFVRVYRERLMCLCLH